MYAVTGEGAAEMLNSGAPTIDASAMSALVRGSGVTGLLDLNQTRNLQQPTVAIKSSSSDSDSDSSKPSSKDSDSSSSNSSDDDNDSGSEKQNKKKKKKKKKEAGRSKAAESSKETNGATEFVQELNAIKASLDDLIGGFKVAGQPTNHLWFLLKGSLCERADARNTF